MEGGTVGRPPLLDGTNYDYWKSRMMAFLKSMDSQTWKAVIKGWEHPVMRGTTELKPEENWSKKEDELALANNKALNALFSGVDKYIFRLIKQCTVAKDAWEILKTTHEGTPKVKMSRLQLLTTKFENLGMKEDESVHDFHMNVIDFANSFDSLGEKIPEEKLVRKILRSLPRKFDMKVTAIEEAQDISSMKVDELIGSLQTFELYINERSEIKNNISKNGNVQRKGEPGDETVEHIAAFTGRYESDEDSCDENITFDELSSTYKELLTRYEEMCRILEKQKKTINKLQAEVNIQVEKATQAEEKVIQVNVQMDDLRKRVSQLNPGNNFLEQILESVPSGKARSVGYNYTSLNQHQLNPETKFMPAEGVVDPCTGNVMLKHHTQHLRKNPSLNQYQQDPETKFTSAEDVFDLCTGKKMLEHHAQHSKAYPVPKFESDSKPHVHQRPKSQKRYRRWVCHHCGKKGHIRPLCFKLYGYPEQNQQAKPAPEVINVKKEWKPKDGSSTLNTKATPITTSTMKKGTSMHVSESPSSSIYVPFGTETRPLVKVKSDETLGQPSLNVGIECANMSPTKVVDTVIGSLKETLHESNVVPDVSTSVALPWQTSDLLLLL
ncbi:gag-protease polyprotein [Trifolium repens]|nr:gag-protease polyprotein [Trifolium repens]